MNLTSYWYAAVGSSLATVLRYRTDALVPPERAIILRERDHFTADLDTLNSESSPTLSNGV